MRNCSGEFLCEPFGVLSYARNCAGAERIQWFRWLAIGCKHTHLTNNNFGAYVQFHEIAYLM